MSFGGCICKIAVICKIKVRQIKEVKTNIGWETLKDIRGIPARNPGKSYYLYVVDPLEKGEDND